MRANGAVPAAGPEDLGIRTKIDIQPDSEGRVDPGTGGMSMAPDNPLHLPRFHRPPSLGGSGTKPVWAINRDGLPGTLSIRHDPKKPLVHALLEPTARMTFDEYVDEIEGTAEDWAIKDV